MVGPREVGDVGELGSEPGTDSASERARSRGDEAEAEAESSRPGPSPWESDPTW